MIKKFMIFLLCLISVTVIGLLIHWLSWRGYESKRYYFTFLSYQDSLKRNGIALVKDDIYFIRNASLYKVKENSAEKLDAADIKFADAAEADEDFVLEGNTFQFEGKIYYTAGDVLQIIGERPGKSVKLGNNTEGKFLYDNYLYYASGSERNRRKQTIAGDSIYSFKKYKFNRINLQNWKIEAVEQKKYEELYRWNDRNLRFDYKSFFLYNDLAKLFRCSSIDLPFIRQYQQEGDTAYILFEEESRSNNPVKYGEVFYKISTAHNKLEKKDLEHSGFINGFAVCMNKIYVNAVDNFLVFDMDSGFKVEIDINDYELGKD